MSTRVQLRRPYGDNGFHEDYTAHVRGEPIGCAVLITSNAAGQTQRVAANYRPRTSLLLMSRLLGENFAGAPIPSTSSPTSPETSVARTSSVALDRNRVVDPPARAAGARRLALFGELDWRVGT